MNKKRLILYSSFLLFFINNNASTSYMGRTRLNNAVYKESLEVNGRLTFDNLTVKGTLSVNGRVDGKNLHTDTLDVNGRCEITDASFKKGIINGHASLYKISTPILEVRGKCDLENSSISELLDVKGRLQTNNVTAFKINVCTTCCILENTTIEHDLVVDVSSNSLSLFEWLFGYRNSSNSIAEIELRGTTHIKGNIIFKNGKGIVHCDSKARVLGNIKSGTLVKS